MTISAVSHILKHRIPLPLNAKSKYYVVSTPTAGGSINHPSPSTLEAPPNEPNECHSLRFDERTKQRYQEMFFFFKYSSHTESFGVWSRYRQTVMDIWKRRLHAYADGATQCSPLLEWQQNPNFLHFISILFLPAALPSWCISHLHHAEMCLRSFGPSHKRVRSHFLLVMSGQVLS